MIFGKPPAAEPESLRYNAGMNASTPDILIYVNGHTRTVPADCSVESLLQELGMAGQRVAVEVNQTVVPRGEHGRTRLEPDDRVEVIRAIGGG